MSKQTLILVTGNFDVAYWKGCQAYPAGDMSLRLLSNMPHIPSVLTARNLKLNRSRKKDVTMTYEMNELMEVGDAGLTIQACKCVFIDELTGVVGPNEGALEDE